MRRTIILDGLLLLAPAFAQAFSGVPVDKSMTVGTSAVQVLAAVPNRVWAKIELNTAGVTVACSWTSTSPAAWSNGSFTYSGQGTNEAFGQLGGGGFIPSAAYWCVSSAAGASLTVQVYPQ